MIARSKKIFGYFFCLMIAVLYAKATCAYVLQGPHIIELMTKKLGEAESLFISQRVVFYIIPPPPDPHIEGEGVAGETSAVDIPDNQQTAPDETDALQPNFKSAGGRLDDANNSANPPDDQQALPDQPAIAPVQTETIQLDESLRYVFSEAFRSDSVSDNNQRIYIFRDGQTLTVIDGVISNDTETRFDLYKDLLLFRSREALSQRLSELGVDISVSSLGKFEGQPAFVVGAEYPDETLPQVWIAMETFQPLRMIIPGGSSLYNTDFLEIRYSQWQKIGKIWYPMWIEFIQDGAVVRTIEVNDYQVNPAFSRDVFDIARLKLEFRQPMPAPDPRGETEGLSEVQKTIEEFKKIFE